LRVLDVGGAEFVGALGDGVPEFEGAVGGAVALEGAELEALALEALALEDKLVVGVDNGMDDGVPLDVMVELWTEIVVWEVDPETEAPEDTDDAEIECEAETLVDLESEAVTEL